MKPYALPKTWGWDREHEELARVFYQWGVTDWEATRNVMGSRANSEQVTEAERTVTVRFVKGGKTVTLPMSRYATASQNLKALTLCLDDMRMLERRGLDDAAQAAYLQLGGPVAPVERDPWEVLGLRPDASVQQIEAMFRLLAQTAHPDHGGTDAAMEELNRARARALEARQ